MAIRSSSSARFASSRTWRLSRIAAWARRINTWVECRFLSTTGQLCSYFTRGFNPVGSLISNGVRAHAPRRRLGPRSEVCNCDQTKAAWLRYQSAMAKRQCLECGGELVMAFRPSENGPGPRSLVRNAKWRCSICGNAFSSEQLRADKRVSSKVVEQA
jgi:hypothetical protein